MDSNAVWIACAAATVPCLMLDLAAGAIQRHHRRIAGVGPAETSGVFLQLITNLVSNVVVLAAFSFLYASLWAGSGKALLYGGIVWLTVAIPTLLLSRYMDETQRKILAVRTLTWLFKAGAASASLVYFIG